MLGWLKAALGVCGLGVCGLVVALAALPAVADDGLRPRQLRVQTSQGVREVTLWVRAGFSIEVFAQAPGALRTIVEAPSGEFVVSDMTGGRVLVLYVAETHRVLRLDPWHDAASADEIIRLPFANDQGGHPNHKTRTLVVGPDRKLYVSIGSFCDACVEDDPLRAAIWRFNLDGSGGEPFASGLRNAVGMTFEPGTDRLWVTENGSNELGEELPPDEINIVAEAGGDFGWPFCYGQREVHPPLGSTERCAGTVPSALDLPAHIAPLGLAFVTGDRFPKEYQGDLFVALHGSALRDNPVGYTLVRVPVREGQPQPPVEFARGWLVGDDSWGRPMLPLFARDGSLLLTDDKAGVVFRIYPAE
jgi:glucose/arabinose dehydrogenase